MLSKLKKAAKAVKKAVTPKKKVKIIDLPYSEREMIFVLKLQELMTETGVTIAIATRDTVPPKDEVKPIPTP